MQISKIEKKKKHRSLLKAKTNLKSEGTGVDLSYYALVR